MGSPLYAVNGLGDRNVEALIANFAGYVARFEASNTFSGPSVYFHHKAIERRRSHDSAGGLLADQQLLEYVYAMLPACGMHRMGAQRAKVTEYSQLVSSLRAAAPDLRELWPLDITELDPGSVPAVGEQAWRVIASIKASTSETQIVAGSKVLHHVLPDLIPPIDRQYTFRFFTGQKAVRAGDRHAFLEWFPYLADIGRRCRNPIDTVMCQGTRQSAGRAKVIDNAIIGFMITRDERLASDASLGPAAIRHLRRRCGRRRRMPWLCLRHRFPVRQGMAVGASQPHPHPAVRGRGRDRPRRRMGHRAAPRPSGLGVLWHFTGPGQHGVDLVFLTPDDEIAAVEVKGTLATGRIPRLSHWEMDQMSAEWVDKADNPGMAELGLHSFDIYGAVAAVNFADITWRTAATSDFSALCPVTRVEQLAHLGWLTQRD